MSSRIIELEFPSGGRDNSQAYQRQRPFTTVDSLNVWPRDMIGNRRRGGSRAGVEKHSSTQLGGGSPVRMLMRYTDPNYNIRLMAIAGSLAYYETSPGVFEQFNLLGFSNTGRICWTVLNSTAYFVQDGATNSNYFNGLLNNGGSFGNSVEQQATLGIVPLNCRIVWSAFGRLGFAGDRTSNGGAPRTVYVSRPDTPNDFDYTETDTDAAYSEAIAPHGNENDALTAVVPWYGDYVLFFYKNSCVLQIGDRPNGYYYTVSTRIGCLDSMSWCRGPNNSIYIMSKEGLAVCDPGSPRSEPKLISSKKLPNDLLQIDPTRYEVVMAWDARANGIHICLTNTNGAQDTNRWFYDLVDGGFWKSQYATPCDPFSVCYYPELSGTTVSLLWGTRNGYIRRDNDSAETDDGTAFDSYVYLGPIQLGNGLTNGILNRLGANLQSVETELATEGGTLLTTEGGTQLVTEAGSSNGSANYALYVGNSAEEAYTSSAVFSSAISGGRNKNHLPRKRGVAAYVKVYGTAGIRWGLEGIAAEIQSGGRFR